MTNLKAAYDRPYKDQLYSIPRHSTAKQNKINGFTDINECVSLPCQNDGTCVDGANEYGCQCLPGWTGNECETGKITVCNA